MEDYDTFWDVVAGNMNDTVYVLVYARARIRLFTRPTKLPPSLLKVSALKISEKHEALSTTIATVQQCTTDEVSAGNQWKTLRAVIKEASFKELGKTKQVQDWTPATIPQLPAKTKEAHFS